MYVWSVLITCMAGITFRGFITFMGGTRAICTAAEWVIYSYMPKWGKMNSKKDKKSVYMAESSQNCPEMDVICT